MILVNLFRAVEITNKQMDEIQQGKKTTNFSASSEAQCKNWLAHFSWGFFYEQRYF